MLCEPETSKLKEQFNSLCEVINLHYEYTDYTGNEKYGIITKLTQEELQANFAELLDEYKPYILLNPSFAEVRNEYRRNEKKHEMRAMRGSLFSIDDEFDVHHPECASNNIAEYIRDTEIDPRLIEGLKALSPVQRKRFLAYSLYNISSREMAEIEGVSKTSINNSIVAAKEKLKKFLK